MKQSKAAILPIWKLSTFLTKVFLRTIVVHQNPASEENHCLQVIVDHFSNYIVAVPFPKDNAHYAVHSSIHRRISKIDPPQYLITDQRRENLNSLKRQSAVLCLIFVII